MTTVMMYVELMLELKVIKFKKKSNKIAIWATECENREAVTHIGRVYKERLGLPPKSYWLSVP